MHSGAASAGLFGSFLVVLNVHGVIPEALTLNHIERNMYLAEGSFRAFKSASTQPPTFLSFFHQIVSSASK